ncbi:hypothetical protein DR999_PMT06866 [Platysternon megacephalum]|uniref:Secreted protein n=1 Tax=Platysternon megacephalum TaxID=55544 RepID=A0A4D9EPA4_9SAUR|nr:hypothetical protein DR999_PMT06866 [Platysternon megacephalum]
MCTLTLCCTALSQLHCSLVVLSHSSQPSGFQENLRGIVGEGIKCFWKTPIVPRPHFLVSQNGRQDGLFLFLIIQEMLLLDCLKSSSEAATMGSGGCLFGQHKTESPTGQRLSLVSAFIPTITTIMNYNYH